MQMTLIEDGLRRSTLGLRARMRLGGSWRYTRWAAVGGGLEALRHTLGSIWGNVGSFWRHLEDVLEAIEDVLTARLS